MKNQLTSLELSKELDSLGVKVESAFSYIAYYGKWECIYVECEENDWRYADEKIPAYSLTDLLAIAPPSTSILKRTDIETNTIARYYVETFDHFRGSDYHENPAEALGVMIAYLAKNNLLDVTKLNV